MDLAKGSSEDAAERSEVRERWGSGEAGKRKMKGARKAGEERRRKGKCSRTWGPGPDDNPAGRRAQTGTGKPEGRT